MGRERSHDAFQSLSGIRSIQAGKNEVPGFGRLQDHFHGFTIAQFAHQDHFGRLPQCGSHGHGEVRCVTVQFALMDGGLLVIVQKLDGIFDGDDVADLFFVDAVQQRRQRGRLPRSARPRHQNNAVPETRNFPQLRRQAQRGELGNGGGNHAHDHSATAALDENVDPKAGQTRQAEGDIAGALLAQHVDRLLVVADEIGGDAAGIVGGEHRNPGPCTTISCP